MKRTKKSLFIRFSALLLVAVLVLSGCTGGEKKSDEVVKLKFEMFAWGETPDEEMVEEALNAITREKIAWLKSMGDDVYFDLRGKTAMQEEVALTLDAGIPVEAWIVNDFRRIVELESWGVTGFTTDLYSLDGCLY